MRTIEQDPVEMQADKLLADYGCFNTDDGVYRETHLSRKIIHDNAKAIASGQDIEWNELIILDGYNEPPRVSLAELIIEARLTVRQRRAVNLMMQFHSQTIVARAMGTRRPAVSLLLSRAFQRVHAVYPHLQAQEPSQSAWRMFRDELQYKRLLIYRKNITREKVNKS
ncbi:MAG: hypothetical protein ACYC27_03045 [Armatimonadota bacterium]